MNKHIAQCQGKGKSKTQASPHKRHKLSVHRIIGFNKIYMQNHYEIKSNQRMCRKKLKHKETADTAKKNIVNKGFGLNLPA